MTDTFMYIWQLLNPAYEFTTPGRRDACRRLWESFDLERQRYTYRTIRDKLRRGEQVKANPYYAIEDNSHMPEQWQPRIEPMNYFGRQLPRGKTYYKADYRGQRGLYAEEDVKAHRMANAEEFIRT